MDHTKRLFWDDPYQVAFDATIIENCEHEGTPAVCLDVTAFYPTSGGQPNDIGTLGGSAVVDVVEVGERVVHLLEAPLAPGAVHGQVDWARRWDHMQQHTGQHILSQAFLRLLNAETVGFHLGHETCTIDIAANALDAAQVAAAEDLANRVILENRPITVREVEPAELTSLALRKTPTVDATIRIVTIAEFDVIACCGTHLRATGEVGSIHITHWEARRGQMRVEFVCGQRAVADHRLIGRICRQLAGQLSVVPAELPQAVDRLVAAEKTSRSEMVAMRKRLLEHEIVDLAAQAESVGGLRLLCRVLEGYDAGNMRYVAQNLVGEAGTIVLFAVTDPSPQLCFARAEDIDVNMGTLLQESAGPWGGRGGGRPHMAQGGGVAEGDLASCLDAARQRLVGMLG